MGAWEGLYTYALGYPAEQAVLQGVTSGATSYGIGKALQFGGAAFKFGAGKAVQLKLDLFDKPLTVQGSSNRLYHYTTERGMNGIVDSQKLNPSLLAINPKDARFGDGQYLSDIVPGTKKPSQLAFAFIRNRFQGRRFTHYIEIDTTGLEVIKGRTNVFLVPNQEPLDLIGRLIGHGPVNP